VAEHLSHDPNIQGSNTAGRRGRKLREKCLNESTFEKRERERERGTK
jgi:hypothetical protein